MKIPSFTLAFSPASVVLPRGTTATGMLAVTPINGFNGAVAYTASGLPAGVTATFNPTATGGATLTLAASASAPASTSTITISGTSGSITTSTTFSLTVQIPSFTLAFTPGSLGVPRGSSASGIATVIPTAGFNATIALAATGLPTGVMMTPGKPTTLGIPVTFGTSATAIAGSFPVTLTGTSGTLTSSVKLTINVIASQAGTTFVNLAPSFNINAFDSDGQTFAGSGLDGGLNGSFTAYSANLIGLQQTIAGTNFYFGPANSLNSVSGLAVTLPAGQFTSLKLLATAVNGNQAAQTFKVTYTDGTSTSFTQSLSDWFTPSSFVGETRALVMAHRVTGTGAIDNRTFNLYAYSLTLNPTKTVASFTLPNNRNVVLLAATLSTSSAAVH